MVVQRIVCWNLAQKVGESVAGSRSASLMGNDWCRWCRLVRRGCLDLGQAVDWKIVRRICWELLMERLGHSGSNHPIDEVIWPRSKPNPYKTEQISMQMRAVDANCAQIENFELRIHGMRAGIKPPRPPPTCDVQHIASISR